MSDNRGVLVIGEDAILKGEIRNCREIEIFGYVEGLLEAGKVTVHPQGRLFGNVKAETAEVFGQLQGDVRVKQLIAIRSSGTASSWPRTASPSNTASIGGIFFSLLFQAFLAERFMRVFALLADNKPLEILNLE